MEETQGISSQSVSFGQMEQSNGGWYIDDSDSMIICDVCGEEFSYPNEGQLQQGFGICDECGTK
jgi:hypothetical protein